MKKKIITIFLFLFILLLNPINVNAQTKTIILSQGMYKLKDTNLLPNISYNIRNISPGKSLIMIINPDQSIQELLRLEPNSPKYVVRPLTFGDIIIIIGESKLEFSY